ncbi:hypothetical protein BG006_006540 [Podila minutissima]|uniref:L domain-like protein n=1 Tax=Podila minutissima TaxID=64525 RepID=A0A9P5SIJ5_9FUNG|nr:hypothetical protein BG006_006540 [Podila minutissima]
MSRPSVRETIAAARARMAKEQAQSKAIRGGAEHEREAFMSSGIPGVRRTTPAARRQTDVEVLGHVQKSIKSLIANAKGTGIMNISSRDLTEVPHEIWNMYTVDPDKVVIDFNATGTAWYDAVDLTRLIAADNKITFIGPRIQEFGALTVVDFHGNELTDLPEEIGQLGRLATLNLSSNKFTKLPEVLFTLTTLLELQLANNQLSGTLDPAIGRLNKVESLDLTGNQLSDLPLELSQSKSMRKLKLSKNKLTSLPVAILAQMPKLIELEVGDNRMACLFSGLGELPEGLNLPALSRMDARNAGLQHITDIDTSVDDTLKPTINLPAVKELLLSVNSLNNLENLLLATPQLHFLDIRNNRFTQIPLGVLDLATLRHLDMTSNHMEHIPTELGNMYDLTTFDWSGNPVRNVPRTCTTTDALMKLLRQRQENDFPTTTDTIRVEALAITGSQPSTPPPSRPSQTLVSERSSVPVQVVAETASVAPSSPKKPTRPVKNLNLTKKALKDVTTEEIMEACSEPQIAILDSNLLASFPIALHQAFGTTTLTQISIHHNKISEFPFQLSFPFLVSLNLSDNLIVTLSGPGMSDESAAEIGQTNFPKLNELQISGNKLTDIPGWMPKAFPALRTLNASRNKITALNPASFTGLQFVDLSSNDIGSLPPLLGNVRTIKSLNLDGNLFRVPRRQIMEQGTEAIMEYLRDRIPA